MSLVRCRTLPLTGKHLAVFGRLSAGGCPVQSWAWLPTRSAQDTRWGLDEGIDGAPPPTHQPSLPTVGYVQNWKGLAHTQ